MHYISFKYFLFYFLSLWIYEKLNEISELETISKDVERIQKRIDELDKIKKEIDEKEDQFSEFSELGWFNNWLIYIFYNLLDLMKKYLLIHMYI